MKEGFVIIWLLCLGITSSAQVYQTQAGTVFASGRYKGASVTAVSDHLFIHLNYDRAEIHLRLMIPTLFSENDSLNGLLQNLLGQELTFDGKMNIVFVQTKSHPKQKFTTQGMLFLNGIGRPINISCVLEHFPRGSISCNLSAEFVISLNEFGIDAQPGENKIAIRFTQLVLKKSGEQ